MQQLKNKNNHHQHASTPAPCLSPTRLLHSHPRAYPPEASANPLYAFAYSPISIASHRISSHLHRILVYIMFAPALLRTARPAASRIAPIASRLASSSTKLTIANENFPLPTGEEVDPQCTSLRHRHHTHHHLTNTNTMLVEQ